MKTNAEAALPARLIRYIKRRLELYLVDPLLLRRGLRPAGYIPLKPPYINQRFGYDEEDRIKEAISLIDPYSMSMSSFERMASLWQQVRYLTRCRRTPRGCPR